MEPYLQSRISAAIRQANTAGRLGLIVYVVPGYPDLDTYRQTLAMLDSRDEVSVIETTVPVAGGFETASEPIIRAHKIARENLGPNPYSASIVATSKPNFAVLYKETFSELGMIGYLERYKGAIDGVVPEFLDESYPESHASLCHRAGVEHIVVVEPEMSEREMDDELSYGLADGMIYLACSPQTAGKMAAIDAICRCADEVRRRRPDGTIAAGMGIRGAAEIATLAATDQIDAVVVGTAFLECVGEGLRAAEAFLDSICNSLVRSKGCNP